MKELFKKPLFWGIVILILAALGVAYWWFVLKPKDDLEVSDCKKSGIPGKIINGICVTTEFNIEGEVAPCGGPRNPC